MQPRIGLLTPLKAGFGVWLQQFRAAFQADTAATAEWKQRSAATGPAIAFCPARMVDSAEEMLGTWKRNSNDGKVPTSAFLPVVLVAIASDYTETPSEDGRPITDKIPFSFPDDPEKRSFRLRLMRADIRAQIVVIATEALSVQSIMGQLFMHIVEFGSFKSTYSFAGFDSEWPCRIVPTDRLAIPTPLGEQISILAVDLNLRASMPLFYGDGSDTDPQPYPVTEAVTNRHDPEVPRPEGATEDQWQAFFRITGHPAIQNGEQHAPGVYGAGVLDATAPK